MKKFEVWKKQRIETLKMLMSPWMIESLIEDDSVFDWWSASFINWRHELMILELDIEYFRKPGYDEISALITKEQKTYWIKALVESKTIPPETAGMRGEIG